MTTQQSQYPARLEVDYPEKLDRLTTFLRVIWVIPILLVLGLVSANGSGQSVVTESGEEVWVSSGISVLTGLWLATMLMLVFRQKYPRWWFDFAHELTRFGARVGSYMGLLTDRYPSTDEEQSVHLEVDYPEAADLSRWLPLFKWILAIPHYFVLAFLGLGALLVIVIAWFAILITGRYPRALFDYVVGVGRWALRVQAYASLLVTDEYPPFSLR